ncbi:helix-hairpin-helix domain-containing protein [Paenibacillus sp. GSMTC-2017]
MFPTPKDLLHADESELTIFKGIGKAKARHIVAALRIDRTISLTL